MLHLTQRGADVGMSIQNLLQQAFNDWRQLLIFPVLQAEIT
jgi:hypothetical protein